MYIYIYIYIYIQHIFIWGPSLDSGSRGAEDCTPDLTEVRCSSENATESPWDASGTTPLDT